MHIKLIFIFSTLCFCSTGQSQSNSKKSFTDTALAKKITISDFCLCKTTLNELKNLDSELQEVEVEEMEMCKDGFMQDTRFVNRKGYSSKKYPGIIFQKDRNTDYISKIRLAKDFTGKLPDGTFINMKTLIAKDVFKVYPKFDTWNSRGCSDYWKLTNDTLSFFVKIDKNRRPQYPVDQAYYSEKPIEGIDLVVSCANIFENANSPYKRLFNDPVVFVDSINVLLNDLEQYSPTDIASVIVYKDSNAIRLVGEQGKYGVVYFETKKFARNKYWNYFKQKSPDYLKVVPNPESDSSVVYILNNEVLTTKFESDLSAINDKTFIDLKIIDKQRLIKEYGISNKNYGILIVTNIQSKTQKNK